ncbi:hypothetical protein PISMIDRAFT_115006, partial [Pisolithus microcarpus 441]
LKWIHLNQHTHYTCTFCGKCAVVGTWRHCSCRKSVAGGGYTVTITTAVTIWR